MRDFTLKAFNVHAKKPASIPSSTSPVQPGDEAIPMADVQPSSPDLYFIPTFWTLVQDDTPISLPLTELAMNALTDAIRSKYNENVYLQYINLCMQNLKAHKSIKQSLYLARYIFMVINAYKTTPQYPLVAKVLSKLHQSLNLVELLLSDFAFYLDVSRHKSASMTEEEHGERVFAGKYSHSQNLDIRFKFLEFILSQGSEDIKMGKENLQKLWDLFVTDSPALSDTKQFFRWISAEKESGASVVPVSQFTAEENVKLFETICKARELLAEKLGLVYYKCFAKHFKLVNMQNSALTIVRTKFNIKDYDRLQGLDALWENVSQSAEDQLRIKFSELLIDVYIYFAEGLKEKQPAICGAFLSRCMKEIMSSDSELVVGNLVKLMLLFIETIDGTKYTEPDTHAAVSKFSLTLIHKPSTTPFLINDAE